MIEEGFDELRWLRPKFPTMPTTFNRDQGFIYSLLVQCGIKELGLIKGDQRI